MIDKNINNILRFSGSVTASVSHEIKNNIAVINEYAGLLEDLVFMSKKEKTVQPERLLDIAGKIKKQVTAADRVIGNLNKFGHTTDNFYYTIDINEVLILSVNLFKRIFITKNIELETLLCKTPVTVNTSSFLLMNLILSSIENFALLIEKGGTIKLGSEIYQKKAIVFITSENTLTKNVDESFFLKNSAPPLLSELKAELLFNANEKKIVITLPADITCLPNQPEIK